jgi:hypothetical protein
VVKKYDRFFYLKNYFSTHFNLKIPYKYFYHVNTSIFQLKSQNTPKSIKKYKIKLKKKNLSQLIYIFPNNLNAKKHPNKPSLINCNLLTSRSSLFVAEM